MNRAVKKYLRQVKNHLYCPNSLKKKCLCRLEDDLLLFCEQQDAADYGQLTEHFGYPKDMAADLFNQLDINAVSRFAYLRLKAAYLSLAVALILTLSALTYRAVDCYKMQQLVSGARAGETYIHPNGRECTVFWVRTNYRGRDLYWEYHSCMECMHLILPPAEADGTEPYATDIYLNDNGTIEHWTFGQEHAFWIRVHDNDV